MTKKRMNHLLATSVVLLCSVAVVAPATAQKKSENKKESAKKKSSSNSRIQQFFSRKASKFEKRSPNVMKLFTPIVKQARMSTVNIKCDGKFKTLGTVVNADGWILTKASELSGKLRCKLPDGREMEAEIAGIHEKTDLAMLKVNTRNLIPVDWSTAPTPQVGHWLATVGLQETPLSIGVVSVNPRPIANMSGILGVGLDEGKEGPKVNSIVPKSGAQNAGIKVGDVILSVNGKKTGKRQLLIETVREYNPGDILKLKVKRAGKDLSILATLGKRKQSARSLMQNTMGGPLSSRRMNFPKAMQHDTILHPTQCGGPVVDLSGKVIGINIARSGRVESLALTHDVFRHMIPDFIAGKYLPKVPSLAERLVGAEKKLQDALKMLEVVEKAASTFQKAEAQKAQEEYHKKRDKLLAEQKKQLEALDKEHKKQLDKAIQNDKKKVELAKKSLGDILKSIKAAQKELDELKAKTEEENKKVKK